MSAALSNKKEPRFLRKEVAGSEGSEGLMSLKHFIVLERMEVLKELNIPLIMVHIQGIQAPNESSQWPQLQFEQHNPIGLQNMYFEFILL